MEKTVVEADEQWAILASPMFDAFEVVCLP